MNTLAERAVLMRLCISLPGEHRQDPGLTSTVKSEHALGSESGKWVKALYPPTALAEVKQLDNSARAYHASVTLPFDAGIGILPAALIMEHGDWMRDFKNKREVLVEKFLANPEEWLSWAIKAHNGTFNPEEYPGCHKVDPAVHNPQSVEAVLLGNDFWIDKAEWRAKMSKKFSVAVQPLPVPQADHFCNTVASLLGTDTDSVDLRVKDAAIEAQKELLRRILEPVAAMAAKLGEQPKLGKDGKARGDIVFRDSLVGNLKDIARIGPALNLGADATIDGFIAEVEALSAMEPDKLREDKGLREQARAKAEELAKRMSAYQF